MSTDPTAFDPVESVVSRQVTRLGALPADATTLQRRFDAVLDEDVTTHPPHPAHRWAPLSAIAAAFLCLGFAYVFGFGRAAALVAEPSELVRFHTRLSGGHFDVTPTRNLDPLGKLVQTRGMPPNESAFPAPLAHAARLQMIGERRFVGVLVDHAGRAVTVAFTGDAEAELDVPAGEQAVRDGTSVTVVARGEMHAAFARIGDKVVCAIGNAEPDALVTLLATLAK